MHSDAARAVIRRLAVAGVCLMAACAAPGAGRAPQPCGEATATQIAPDRWLVRHVRPPGMAEATSRDFALRRAAEATLAAGRGHFRVVSVDSRSEIEREGWVGQPRVGGAWGSRSGLAVGLGVDVGAARVTRRAVTEIEIAAFAGPRPAGDGVSYDAAALAAGAPLCGAVTSSRTASPDRAR